MSGQMTQTRQIPGQISHEMGKCPKLHKCPGQMTWTVCEKCPKLTNALGSFSTNCLEHLSSLEHLSGDLSSLGHCPNIRLVRDICPDICSVCDICLKICLNICPFWTFVLTWDHIPPITFKNFRF